MAKCSLFLDGGEELAGGGMVAVVVDAGGEEVGDLLVEEAFAGADVADAFEQFIEVVGPEGPAGLDPLVVHREALGEQFGEPGGGPLAERGAARRSDAIADGEDHVERVVLEGSANLSPGLVSNL
jgi:hypothetical protein